MIIKGNQRGGALQLADHLMNVHDNEHVEIHSINGFIAKDVHGALQEIYAVSQATNAKQFMFSMSLSPPEKADVSIDDYEEAIEKAIDNIGLTDQPRITLFHEKNGRRHCHVVISRIDTEKMKAINLPFYKERLNSVARELFLDHGWELPKGFRDKSLSNPLNYTLEEYQVAKRAKRDPREIKAVLKQSWNQSDNRAAFEGALEEKGFYLCKGDRRGFVIMDWQNKVYSLSRWIDQKPKALKERLGDPTELLSIEETETKIADMMKGKQQQYIKEIRVEFERRMKPLEAQKFRITKNHHHERQLLLSLQKQRQEQEALERSKRFRSGITGVWDWISGKRKKICQKNKIEQQNARKRDHEEYRRLIYQQRLNLERLQKNITKTTLEYEKQIANTYRTDSNLEQKNKPNISKDYKHEKGWETDHII